MKWSFVTTTLIANQPSYGVQVAWRSQINASGGTPEEPAPDSGEAIQLPPVQSRAGQAAVKSVNVGDQVITVRSQQTAIKATVIR